MKKRKNKNNHRKVKLDKVNRCYVIQKSDINTLLSALLADYAVIGPKLNEHRDYLFSYLNNPEEFALEYTNTVNTAKEFLFPRQEVLFDYKKAKHIEVTSNAKNHNERPAILFGIRSCDTRAVNFHDFFFSRNLKDSYYSKHRNNIAVVNIACNQPRHNSCFCNSVSAGPFLQNEEFDMQLVDLGLLFLVESNSSKGHTLIKRYKHIFHKSVDSNIQERYNLQKEGLKKFKHNYNLEKISKKLSNEGFMQLWQNLAKRCQNCGGCEFICPTCFCFNMYDTQDELGSGKKVRSWDSCTFSGFSKMANNINPSGEDYKRIARRFYCKLFNSFKWSGMFGCVGCGRCSFVCPVNLDMESFVSLLSGSNNTKVYKPLLNQV